MIRGFAIDCGCFSNEGETKPAIMLIVRNLFLIVISLMIIRFDGGFLALSRYLAKRQ